MYKIPTGINALDIAVGGGLPSGSLCLLFGTAGTEKSEFAHTVAAKCAAMNLGKIPKPKGEDIVLPKNVWYVNFSRDKEELLSDVAGSFSSKFYEAFVKGVSFKDLTPPRLMAEFPPWLPDSFKEKRLVVVPLAQFFDKNGPNSIVVMYTLTNVAKFFQGEQEYDFTSFLQGLRTQAKRWNGIIYAILGAGVLRKEMEYSIISAADGVFAFDEQYGATGRRILLSCRKFRGLLPSCLSNVFELNITPEGLDVERIRTLEGRR
jgi:KaiC/GvpD/RAD55 family RecA-like ATPase